MQIYEKKFIKFLYWFKNIFLFIFLFAFIASLLDEYSFIEDDVCFIIIALGASVIFAYIWNSIINPLVKKFIKK